MSGQFWLDWAGAGGLAVQHRAARLAGADRAAQRRAPHLGRARWRCGGLLAGAAFFVSHSRCWSARELSALIQDFGFWWQVGWMPLIAAAVRLVPADAVVQRLLGRRAHRRLRRRQRFWFWLTLALALVMAGLLLAANPLPVSPTRPTSRSSACPPWAACR